jgi:hypothetical protein
MKKLLSAVAALVISGSAAFGGAGIYDSFVIVDGAFYDIGATTPNPDFQGAFLGTFDPTHTFMFGGQQKSFKNDGTDVTGHQLQFRVYQTTPSGTFNVINYSFQWNFGDPGAPGNLGNPGDQQWGTDVQGANTGDDSVMFSLAGLAPGTYTLEVFSLITTNGVNAAPTIFNNQGGANYTATFTVIPEPSSLSLLAGPALLGAWFYVRRRRA